MLETLLSLHENVATFMQQLTYDPHALFDQLALADYVPSWSDRYQNFVPSEYDYKINAWQDSLVPKYASNPTVGFIPPDMEKDFMRVDKLQQLLHYPGLRNAKSIAYGMSDGQIKAEIARILGKW